MLYLCCTKIFLMPTMKIVLRKKKNKDGTLPSKHPLTIRITKDRKTSFIYLGLYIKEVEWNKVEQRVRKNHPNSKRLNNLLIKKLAEANDKSLELESQTNEFSSYAIKQRIKPKGGTTFFSQAELYLFTLKQSGRYNQYTADKPRIVHFKDYLKGGDIAFSDITAGLLEKFKAYLKGSRQHPKSKKIYFLSDRSIVNHLVAIRSVFSFAIKEKITDPKYYPFGKGKVKIKFPDSHKIGLTIDEVKNLETVLLTDLYEDHCRKLWLFSFYFAGMRISDVLKSRFSDFQNVRLHYTMDKNKKSDSLIIHKKAQKIIDFYSKFKEKETDLIFPELKRLENLDDEFITKRTIAFATSRIDKCLRTKVAPLAKIEKPLTMHIARHTFGNISGDKIPIQMLQKLYRHSSITTTIGYQSNFIHKNADEALNTVLNAV